MSISGNRVLGYGVNDQFVIDTNSVVPLTIPFGGSAVAQETNNVTLVGNLQPDSNQVSTEPGVIESVVLNDNSIEKPGNTTTLQQIQAPATGTSAADGNAANDEGAPVHSHNLIHGILPFTRYLLRESPRAPVERCRTGRCS